MKKSFYFVRVFVLILFSWYTGFSQEQGSGINFFHGTFKDALALAKSQDKLVFMDAFTTWCGPCRRMSSGTFPDPNVGSYYNANFVNIKVDMEKDEGPQLAQAYQVGSYPTLLYLDGDGKVVYKTAGMRGPEDFIALGQEVMKKVDKSGAYEILYKNGNRDSETILAYIKSLNASGKSSLKIANEYLATQKDLSSPTNVEIIFEATQEADSKVFDYFIQNKEAYLKIKNQNMFDGKVYQACMKTFQKSLEYRNEDLLKISQEKMKNHSTKAVEFKYNTSMEYYARTGNDVKFKSACQGYTSKLAKNDATRLTQSAQMCVDFFRTNSGIIGLAKKLAERAVKLEGTPNQYLLLANILKLNGEYKAAKDNVLKGLTIAREKMMPTFALEQLMQELQAN